MANRISKDIFNIELDVETLIRKELPNTVEFYDSNEQLNKDIRYLFEHHLGKTTNRTVYQLDYDTSGKIVDQTERYYKFMVKALTRMLSSDFSVARKYYQGLEDHQLRILFDMAKYTFFNHGHGSALYGRFDIAMNPISGAINGFYEFNGDTPCMLFESVNLQNLVAEELMCSYMQENSWWPTAIENKVDIFKGKTVALVCFTESIEDIVNTETLAQVIHECGGTAIMVDAKDLHHDVLNITKPFFVTDNHIIPDIIYKLIPWEEMVINGYQTLIDWPKWINNQKFMEPAWRWFMSHKGFMAFMTDLLDDDHSFAEYRDLPHIRTSLTQDFGDTYVSKPVCGRMSHNITIVKDGEVIKASDGRYDEWPVIYQEFCPTGSINGENFIFGAWVAPHSNPAKTTVPTLCIREFDDIVLGVENERFVPHILVK